MLFKHKTAQFRNEFYAFFDDKNKANIVASYPQSAGIGRRLKEVGKRFAKKNDFSSELPFEMSDRVTTFVYIDSQKVDKHNRTNILNKSADFILTCIDMYNEQLLSEFKEDPELNDCLELIDKTISEHSDDLIYKIDQKNKTITYHIGREFPVYKLGSDLLQVCIKKKKVTLAFRILNKEIYQDLGEKVSVQKSYRPYEIEFNQDIKNIVAESIGYGMPYIHKEIQDLSYGFLKETMEKGWIALFYLLMKKLKDKKEMTFQEGEQLLQENNIKTKVSTMTRGINLFFNTQKIDSPITINYVNETIAIKDKYQDIISDSIKEYKPNIDNDALAFNDFKLLINKLNEDRANMTYLYSERLPRTIISSDNYKQSKDIYFDLKLKKGAVNIGLSIKDNPFAREVKTLHEDLISQNKQQIRGKELIVVPVKGGGENSYALVLKYPLEDINQMKAKDWLNGFVDTFNEFAMTFLKKDYDMLKLVHLQ